MKRFFVSFIGIFSVIVFFISCYYVSFYISVKRLEDSKSEQPYDMHDILHENLYEEEFARLTEEVYSDENIITSDTVCVYEIYHIDSGELDQYEAPPTSDIVGLNRKQLQKRLDEYTANMSVIEFEAGLISYGLVSFSPDKVVIQKVYDGNKVKYKYFVSVRNNEVVVYYSDRKTIYEYTGITEQMLQEEIWNALCIGIPVKDLEELYDYLSGITS